MANRNVNMARSFLVILIALPWLTLCDNREIGDFQQDQNGHHG